VLHILLRGLIAQQSPATPSAVRAWLLAAAEAAAPSTALGLESTVLHLRTAKAAAHATPLHAGLEHLLHRRRVAPERPTRPEPAHLRLRALRGPEQGRHVGGHRLTGPRRPLAWRLIAGADIAAVHATTIGPHVAAAHLVRHVAAGHATELAHAVGR